VEATLAAVKTHNAKKREALRNAVLNSALQFAPDESRQAMFVRWVDELTEIHMELTEIHMQVLLEAQRRQYQPDRVKSLMAWVPGLISSEMEKVVENDLVTRNLIRPTQAAGLHFNQGDTWLTPLGEQFVKFISNPVESSADSLK
jgi:hypothetical protein